jgi:hypothetical protein
MLSLAFGLLLIAAVLGSVLAAMHLRGRSTPRLWLGVVHALLGGTGFVALLFALRGPPRGAAMGVAEFGRIGAVLLALALMVGLVVFVLRVRRRASGLVMGIHASIAISGIVVLAAYTLMG